MFSDMEHFITLTTNREITVQLIIFVSDTFQ